ncbi:MAG: phosphotransferase enzyme family protein [Microthrixaceae bacterium]
MFGVASERELPGASENQHWLVRRGDSPAVLRRVAHASTRGLSYELTVLRELDRRGWPIPVPLTEPVDVDGHTWVLYSWLPGTSPTQEDCHAQRERGRLLARLHGDLAEIVDLGQRDGWQMAHEVVADPSLDELLPKFERIYPTEGHLLRWHARRSRELLAELPVAEAARTVVHGDLAPWNLLFEGDALSGIVDFDIVHLDLTVAEFACSWRGKYDEVIHGYNEVRPLTDLDRVLLTPVFWAWLFIGVADDLRDIVSGAATLDRLAWMMSKLPLRTPAMGPNAVPYPGSP